MNRLHVAIAFALTLLVSACSQTPAGGLEPQLRTAQDDAALYAEVNTDGLYVGATSSDAGYGYNTLEKFARSGSRLWRLRVPIQAGDDYARIDNVALAPGGYLYVAYSSVRLGAEGDETTTGFLRQLTPAGKVLSTRDVSGLNLSGFGYDRLGNLYVAVQPAASPEVRKYRPDGTLLWRTPLTISFWDFAVLPDGSVRVLDYAPGDAAARLLKLGPGGNLAWRKTLAGQAVKLAAGAEGSSFVVGYGESIDPLENTNVLLSKYAASGRREWQRSVTEGGYRDIGALEADARGGVLVGLAGKNRLGSDEDRDIFVSRFTGSGAQAWAKTIASPEEDYLYDIATLSASEFYIVGSTSGSLGGRNRGGSDAFVMRLDGRGNRVWAR